MTKRDEACTFACGNTRPCRSTYDQAPHVQPRRTRGRLLRIYYCREMPRPRCPAAAPVHSAPTTIDVDDTRDISAKIACARASGALAAGQRSVTVRENVRDAPAPSACAHARASVVERPAPATPHANRPHKICRPLSESTRHRHSGGGPDADPAAHLKIYHPCRGSRDHRSNEAPTNTNACPTRN